LVEAPKRKLAAVQRRLLRDVVAPIAPPAAHGFMPGRSPKTHAAKHVGRLVVVGVDQEDFFTMVTYAKVAAVFRTAGYAPDVAAELACLCTTALPANELWHGDSDPATLHRRRKHALRRHLPQGAPTSPGLANLAAWRLDRRLAGQPSRGGQPTAATPTTWSSQATSPSPLEPSASSPSWPESLSTKASESAFAKLGSWAGPSGKRCAASSSMPTSMRAGGPSTD